MNIIMPPIIINRIIHCVCVCVCVCVLDSGAQVDLHMSQERI